MPERTSWVAVILAALAGVLFSGLGDVVIGLAAYPCLSPVLRHDTGCACAGSALRRFGGRSWHLRC